MKKWFPPMPDIADVEKREKRKLDRISHVVIGRINALRDAHVKYDHFTLDIPASVRTETVDGYTAELEKYFEDDPDYTVTVQKMTSFHTWLCVIKSKTVTR